MIFKTEIEEYIVDSKHRIIVNFLSSELCFLFRQMSLCGDLIAVLDTQTGSVQCIRYGGLDRLMEIAYRLELFDYCADILLQKRRLIRNLSTAALQTIAQLTALPRKLADFNKASLCFFIHFFGIRIRIRDAGY